MSPAARIRKSPAMMLTPSRGLAVQAGNTGFANAAIEYQRQPYRWVVRSDGGSDRSVESCPGFVGAAAGECDCAGLDRRRTWDSSGTSP